MSEIFHVIPVAAHEALITAIGVVLAQQPAVLPDKPEPEGKLGSAEELRPLLEKLKLALASEEPLPCMEILEDLSQRRWSEGYETALAEVSRMVQQYRLAKALVFLNEEFDDVMNVGVADLRRNEAFNIHRQGLDVDMVALRKVKLEPLPKSKTKTKKEKFTD